MEVNRQMRLAAYPYRMIITKAMEAHGLEGMMERMGEVLSILDTAAAFTDEERREIKKIIYADSAQMINKFHRMNGGRL